MIGRVTLVFIDCIYRLSRYNALKYVSIVCSVDMVHVCGVLDCPIVDKRTLHTLALLSVHYCEMEGVFKDSLFRSILF